MNPKFRAFNCNPSPPKKSCFQKSPISSLRIKMLGVEFLRIRVNGWLLMTPLLEFPFPFSPSWILLMMGSTAFSWGIFWLEGSDPKKIHPLGGSVFFRDPKHLELMGMLGVPTKMWSELLFFDSKSWGDVLQVPTWIFFLSQKKRIRKVMNRTKIWNRSTFTGDTLFSTYLLPGSIWLTLPFLGEIRLGGYSNSWHSLARRIH